MPRGGSFVLRNISHCVISGPMTLLKAYLDDTREKQAEFADRVRTTPATISRLCAGALKPSLDLAHEIEVATAGRVPMESWIACTPAAQDAA